MLDKTLTAPDRFAIVVIEDARDLWLRRDPLLVQLFGAGGLGRGDLNSGAAVGLAARGRIPTPSRGASRSPWPASTSRSPAR